MSEIDRIAAIYAKHLKIPVVKPTPQFYLVPVGLVGAGKTTILKPLCQKLHLLRISGDEIRKIIQEVGGLLEDTWETGRFLVKKYTQQGYSIAHDTDGATIKTQEAVAELARQFNVKVIWVHVNPPEEFILHKLRAHPQPTWLFKSADEAVAKYFERKPLHQDLQMDFTYEFDPSRPDLKIQIDEAALAIQRRLER